MNQLTPDQLNKFRQLSPKHQEAFFYILKIKDKKNGYQLYLPRHLFDIFDVLEQQDIDQILSEGVYELAANKETHEIVNDYYLVNFHDNYLNYYRRMNFKEEWPPDKNVMNLNVLSYSQLVSYQEAYLLDDIRLVKSRLDNVNEGVWEIYASELFQSLSEAVEARDNYLSHKNLIEIFAISFYIEWTSEEIDGEVKEVPVTNLYEFISPRHITKDLESATHNLIETQKNSSYPKIFYGHFIKKTNAFEYDILPKYISIHPGLLKVLREIDKDNNLDYIHIEEDEKIAEHLFISRQSLSIEINMAKTVEIGIYSKKEKKFHRLMWVNYPQKWEFWRFSVFKDNIPYVPLSNHLKIPVRKNDFFMKILRKMDALQQDLIIQRCQTLIQKIVSLSYFVAYDFSVLNLFTKFIEDYLENNANGELLLELLESMERYFDLSDIKRMNFRCLTNFFHSFLINSCVFFLSE